MTRVTGSAYRQEQSVKHHNSAEPAAQSREAARNAQSFQQERARGDERYARVSNPRRIDIENDLYERQSI